MSAGFGKNLKITIFGESHGKAVGVTAEGFPAGEYVDMDKLNAFLARRSAVGKSFATDRKEKDVPIFQSGIKDGVLLSSPLCAIIENREQDSREYNTDIPRPGHADYTAFMRYNGHCDMRGGGQFSGRLTAPLCIAGGIALQILERRGIRIFAHILRIGNVFDKSYEDAARVQLPSPPPENVFDKSYEDVTPPVNGELDVLNESITAPMLAEIENARASGDSVGGIIECAVTGLKAGSCGGALFDGMEGRISLAVFGIPGVKGIEFGNGFKCAGLRGSQNNDEFYFDESGEVRTRTNNHGGLLGGIPSGMPIIFRAAIKPTPSIAMEQNSVSLSSGENVKLNIHGRHDPCIVPRCVPCIESAAATAILDALLEK